jgi:hypothetical protein
MPPCVQKALLPPVMINLEEKRKVEETCHKKPLRIIPFTFCENIICSYFALFLSNCILRQLS